MRRHPAGYDPTPEKSSNSFPAMGGDLSGVIGDLSFPRVPGVQLMRRGGPVCKHCMLLPEDHQTRAAQAGYEQLSGVPGVHPLTDTARNSADAYADPRRGEFFGSAGR